MQTREMCFGDMMLSTRGSPLRIIQEPTGVNSIIDPLTPNPSPSRGRGEPDGNLTLYLFPGSAWEHTARQAPPALHSSGRPPTAEGSQA